jgi:GNAT superfamily N-acetyltransferase
MTSARSRLAKYAEELRSFPGDAALAYRGGGLRDVWNVLCRRTLHRLVRTGRLVVFAQPLDEAPVIPAPQGVTISPLGLEECGRLDSLVPRCELEHFRRLLAAGRHCLVAWRGTKPIGYGWVAEKIGTDVTLMPLKMPDEAAYLWDLYVVRGERCGGIGSALASARCQLARSRGFREGWRTIVPTNHASLETLRRSAPGARIVGEMRYIKILSRIFAWFTPSPLPAPTPRLTSSESLPPRGEHLGTRAYRSRWADYVTDLRTLPSDAALAYRRGGLRDVWNVFSRRTIHRLVRSGRLVVFAQRLDQARVIPPPDGVTISLLSIEECGELDNLVPRRELAHFRSLLAAGGHCLVARRGISPIAYGWMAEKVGTDVTLVPLEMPADAAFFWDLYVVREERRGGTGSAIASAACEMARGKGFREGWRTIAPTNHASLDMFRRSGSGVRIVGEMRYIKILSRIFSWFTPPPTPAGTPG